MNEDQNQQSAPNVEQQPVPVGPYPAPESPPVQPPSSVVSQVNPLPKRKKMKLFIILVLLAIVVVSGGALAATYVYMNNKPEKVLADALSNTINDTLEGKPTTTLGSVVFESKGAQAAKVTVKFDSKISGENSSASADATVAYEGKTYSLKTSTAVFGDSEYYFKIENLKKTVGSIVTAQPAIGTYVAPMDPIITKLDNNWVKVTKEDLKQFSGTGEQDFDKCTEAVKNLKISTPDQKQLKKLFKENQFIVASENLKIEAIEGEKSFHYKLDFNNAAAEKFAKQVIAMESFKTIKADCEINEKQIEEGFKQAKDSSKSSKIKPVIELWVGKASRRPTKLRVSAHDKDVTLDFNTQVKLGASGVDIQKPSSFITVNELKTEFEKLQQTNTTVLQNL